MEVVLQGVPATSPRGFIGWCSVVVFRREGRVLLFDTGSFGDRQPLLDGLARLGIRAEDVSYVFLSHLHFDHMINYELFPEARLLVSRAEVDYALSPQADLYIPRLYVRHMLEHREVQYVQEGDRILGLEVLALPGHTPGQLGLVDETAVYPSDGLKYAWNLVHGDPGQCFAGVEAGRRSVEKVRALGKVVIPGHDAAFRLSNRGKVEYLALRGAEVKVYADPSGAGPTAVPLVGGRD